MMSELEPAEELGVLAGAYALSALEAEAGGLLLV